MKKTFVIIIMSAMAFITSFANDYVAIAKDGNVYDEASTKYITVNQNNENVSVIPGMVFATSQHTPGWYKVEYSPGLHAFIPEQITSGSFVEVKPGIYNITNNPGHQLKAEGSGDNWTATVDGKSYKGNKYQDIIIFKDNNNNIVYSLVDLGNGPISISYENSVTNFF